MGKCAEKTTSTTNSMAKQKLQARSANLLQINCLEERLSKYVEKDLRRWVVVGAVVVYRPIVVVVVVPLLGVSAWAVVVGVVVVPGVVVVQIHSLLSAWVVIIPLPPLRLHPYPCPAAAAVPMHLAVIFL